MDEGSVEKMEDTSDTPDRSSPVLKRIDSQEDTQATTNDSALDDSDPGQNMSREENEIDVNKSEETVQTSLNCEEKENTSHENYDAVDGFVETDRNEKDNGHQNTDSNDNNER